MPLPKVKHQIYDFVIPSTGKKESFRPFLVKEEKILLMAKASDDPADSLRAVKQIVNNCGIREAFDVDTLTIFDIEYLFIQLRAVSVSNIVTLSYKDNEDNKVYDFTVDLKDIEIKFPETVDKIIKVTDTMGIVMKWPSASLFDDKDYFRAGDQAFYELILRCIDKIYDGEKVYNASEYSAKELEVFLDDCGIMIFNKIQEFMTNVPHIHHILTYTNSNGKKQSIELNGLTDFFTLR
jgi:hypothetical protein